MHTQAEHVPFLKFFTNIKIGSCTECNRLKHARKSTKAGTPERKVVSFCPFFSH